MTPHCEQHPYFVPCCADCADAFEMGDEPTSPGGREIRGPRERTDLAAHARIEERRAEREDTVAFMLEEARELPHAKADIDRLALRIARGEHRNRRRAD